MIVDFTIPTTLRPNLLFQTLYSFDLNLVGNYSRRCVVNIDPMGDSEADQVWAICRMFFEQVKVRESKEPHFGKAVKWLWEQVENDWVFHLEDDWRLNRSVNLNEMISIMESEKDLAILRLPQFKSCEKDMKNWNKFFPWNGRYYECPEELRGGLGVCGHPSLIRGEFIKRVVPMMDANRNPEKQFHSKSGPLMEEVLRWRYGVYGKPGWNPVITDLGRRWMVENGFRKKGNKAFFTEWERS